MGMYSFATMRLMSFGGTAAIPGNSARQASAGTAIADGGGAGPLDQASSSDASPAAVPAPPAPV